jgi:hypothetical protein
MHLCSGLLADPSSSSSAKSDYLLGRVNPQENRRKLWVSVPAKGADFSTGLEKEMGRDDFICAHNDTGIADMTSRADVYLDAVSKISS